MGEAGSAYARFRRSLETGNPTSSSPRPVSFHRSPTTILCASACYCETVIPIATSVPRKECVQRAGLVMTEAPMARGLDRRTGDYALRMSPAHLGSVALIEVVSECRRLEELHAPEARTASQVTTCSTEGVGDPRRGRSSLAITSPAPRRPGEPISWDAV